MNSEVLIMPKLKHSTNMDEPTEKENYLGHVANMPLGKNILHIRG